MQVKGLERGRSVFRPDGRLEQTVYGLHVCFQMFAELSVWPFSGPLGYGVQITV